MPTDKRQRQREGRQYRRAQIEAAQRRHKQRRQGGVVVGIVVLVVALVFIFSRSSTKTSNVSTKGSTTTTAQSGSSTTSTAAPGTPPTAPTQTGATLSAWACPKPDGSSPHTLHFPSSPPPMCIDPAKTYTATLTTSEGPVQITLDTKKTPKTANNFAVLSLYHYYDGTSIDRIDTSIDILQTGSPSTQSISDPGPGYTIPDEGSGYKYTTGDVVMARTGAPNSAGAQYFLVYGAAASTLDGQGTYVTFGHVTQGLDVLKKIADLYEPCPPTAAACLGGAPRKVVLISKVTITAS